MAGNGADLLDLSLDELLTTTRTVRKRLDLTRPVPRALITECLEIAVQAPNGSNQQRWNWHVVDEPDLRAEVAEVYRSGMSGHQADPNRATRDIDYSTDEQQRIASSVAYLRDHLHEVPALLIPTVGGRMDGAGIFLQASVWGSILPAVWNFMLALRARGLGSAWTTIHLHKEAEMAELLGIDASKHTQVGLFPIAYTVGTDFRAGARQDLAGLTRWNGAG